MYNYYLVLLKSGIKVIYSRSDGCHVRVLLLNSFQETGGSLGFYGNND